MPNADPRMSSWEWQQLRKLILARDAFRCQIRSSCCRLTATEVDHIEPPIEGGSFWDPANLRASCRPCNSTRGGQLSRQRAKMANFGYRQPIVPMETRL